MSAESKKKGRDRYKHGLDSDSVLFLLDIIERLEVEIERYKRSIKMYQENYTLKDKDRITRRKE